MSFNEIYKPLVSGLKPLSYCEDKQTDKEILAQWTITNLELVGEKCICGNTNLVHNFEIYNTITGEHAIVGSKCIESFDNPDMDIVVDVVKWHKSPVDYIPEYVARQAYSTWKIIRDKDFEFIVSIGLKRNLSSKQIKWYDSLKRKIRAYIQSHFIH